MGHLRPIFNFFQSFQTNNTIFTTIYLKNVYPVSSVGIRTNNLLNMSLHQYSLDQAPYLQ